MLVSSSRVHGPQQLRTKKQGVAIDNFPQCLWKGQSLRIPRSHGKLLERPMIKVNGRKQREQKQEKSLIACGHPRASRHHA